MVDFEHTDRTDYWVHTGSGKTFNLGLLALWHHLQESVEEAEWDTHEDDFIPVPESELEKRLAQLKEKETEPLPEEIESLSDQTTPALLPPPAPSPKDTSHLLRYFVNPTVDCILNTRGVHSRTQTRVKVYMAYTQAIHARDAGNEAVRERKKTPLDKLYWWDLDPRTHMVKRHAYKDQFLETLRQALYVSMDHLVGQIIAEGYRGSHDARESLGWLISQATLFKTDVSPNGQRVLIFAVVPARAPRGRGRDVDRPQVAVMELPWEPQPPTHDESHLDLHANYEWGAIRRAIETLSRH
ncbi:MULTISPECIES: hypothetical protein [unclassified Streptomyces]|uniref:hypothetical protein n=1 Tax=unclassified Streptomyces TaxID=2593676 RepID=UPI0035E01B7B